MDFGTLRVTYVGDERPVVRSAGIVDRINAQTAKNAAANDRLVERSKKTLADVQTREAKRGADAFIRELERMRRAERASTQAGGGGVGSGLSMLSGGRLAFAGGGAAAGVGAVAVGFIAAAREGISYREVLERLNKSFETLTGSAAAATAHVKELQEFAAKTPFEFESVARASQRFQNMGVAAKDVVPILTAVGNAVAAAGGGSEQIDRVTLAISQMSAKGKVSAEEMNQLAEAGVGGWRLLEQQLGKSKGELMKMAEAGEISADTFIKAFRAAYEGGNAMQKQMETLSGAWSTLKDKGRELLAQAFTPMHSILRDMAVELAKISTEGFNAERGLMAVASVFRTGFGMANPGGGDNLLLALAYQQGGPQLAAAVQQLLRGGPSKEKAQWGQPQSWFDKPVNVPEGLQYKQKFSDADIFRAQQARAQQEAEAAMRKANQEAERQSSIVKRISDDFAEASVRVRGFAGNQLQLEAHLYKLSIGFKTLSEANQKLAQDEINKLFTAKMQLRQMEATAEFEKQLTDGIKEHAAALRGELTETEKLEDAFQSYLATIEKLTGAVPAFKDEQIKLFDEAFGAAYDVDLMNFAERMGRASEMIRGVPLTINKAVGTAQAPQFNPLDFSKVKSNGVEEWRRVAEDLSDIFSNVFEGIEGGWRGMWQEMLNVARTTLQEISRDLLRMALTGQKSDAGGIIGLAANWIGSALFGSFLGGGLPKGSLTGSWAGGLLTPTAIPGLASGTMSAPPGLHWVGERGPELMAFRGGEQVFSNADSRRMLGGQTIINKTTVINYQPKVTPDSYSSRRSAREGIEGLIAAFAR